MPALLLTSWHLTRSRRPHVFILSPANLGGERGSLILRPDAQLALAQQLRSETGAPLREVFSFISSLYFRARPPTRRRSVARPRGSTRRS